MDKSNEVFEHLTFIKDAINISRMMSIAHHLPTNFLSFTLALSKCYTCLHVIKTGSMNCSIKMMFLKILHNSQENICVLVSILKRLHKDSRKSNTGVLVCVLGSFFSFGLSKSDLEKLIVTLRDSPTVVHNVTIFSVSYTAFLHKEKHLKDTDLFWCNTINNNSCVLGTDPTFELCKMWMNYTSYRNM